MQVKGQVEQQELQTAAPDQSVETSESAQKTDSTEGNGQTGAEQQRDEHGRFKPKVQHRIDEITRARHEAEREAAYWRARAEASGTEGKAPSNTANESPNKPTPDQFQDYAEYVESLTEWKADQKVREALSARDADKAKEAQAKVQQTREEAWNERQASARISMPDYDEVVGLSDLQISPHVAETLLDSEQGPALAYHLAKNPDVAERINGLSPLAAAREIGRIEASISSKAATAPAKPVTKPPAPISPVGQRSAPASDPEKMSIDEWMAWRRSNRK